MPVPGRAPEPAGSVFVELELLREQTAGAVHTLNNLFTSLLGELALLGDERKGDALVTESADALREQLERCVRVVRNGLTQPAPRTDADADAEIEVDLGLLLARCERVLEGTLPRRVETTFDVPDDSWVVAGDRAALERFVLATIFRLGRLVPHGPMRLRTSLAPDEDPGKLALRFELDAADLPEDARQRLVDPGLARDERDAGALSALHALADAHGTHLQTERTGPESLRLSLVFARFDD